MVLNMAALIFLILILQALTGKHIILIPMLFEIQVDIKLAVHDKYRTEGTCLC